jgi:hypothetical protein
MYGWWLKKIKLCGESCPPGRRSIRCQPGFPRTRRWHRWRATTGRLCSMRISSRPEIIEFNWCATTRPSRIAVLLRVNTRALLSSATIAPTSMCLFAPTAARYCRSDGPPPSGVLFRLLCRSRPSALSHNRTSRLQDTPFYSSPRERSRNGPERNLRESQGSSSCLSEVRRAGSIVPHQRLYFRPDTRE